MDACDGRVPSQADRRSGRSGREVWSKYRDQVHSLESPDRVSLSTGKPAQSSTALPQYPASLANDGRTRNTNAFWATDVQTDAIRGGKWIWRRPSVLAAS